MRKHQRDTTFDSPHQSRVTFIRLALTGGIATGKSYVLGRLAAREVPTIDADRIAHRVMRNGGPAVAAIRRRFGPGVFGPDAEIDRHQLAQLVFGDTRDRKDLEAIVHPYVRRSIEDWFTQVEANGRASFAVADIPLLFETARQNEFDRVVVTRCPLNVQLDRLRARGFTEEEARKRMAAQVPNDKRIAGADFEIRTEGSYAETDRQVDEVYNLLTQEAST